MGIPWQILVGILLVAGAVAFVFIEAKRTEKRLNKIVMKVKQGDKAQYKKTLSAADRDSLFSKFSFGQQIQKKLNVAGIPISLTSFFLAVSAAGVMLSGVLNFGAVYYYAELFLGSQARVVLQALPLPLLLSLYGSYQLGKAVINILADRRSAKIREQLPQAIDALSRAVRVGRSFDSAIISVADALPDPIGIEFRAVARLLSVGGSPEKALRSIAQDLEIEEFSFLVNTYAVHLETGGNLIEALENLSKSVRDRLNLKAKVEAMITEGKFSAYVISALPFALLTYFYFTNREYIEVLFNDVRGNGILILAVAMIVVGMTILIKMTRIKM